MGIFITYILTLAGIIAYTFIAGMVRIWLRMDFFSLSNERGFSYDIMENSTGFSYMEHAMALFWPIVLSYIFSFFIAEKIFKLWSKNATTDL